MEKRLNKKIETYVTTFKDDIRKKISELSFDEKPKMNELIEFVYDYERMVLIKDDLIKRKRIKNAIPTLNRCNAKRATGEQCTRRRKANCEFCGTHTKGTPHGLMLSNESVDDAVRKLEVVAEEICGIVYYIDKFYNVYKTEDVVGGKSNPEIIAKYTFNPVNKKYSIPSLGLI
jgi:hypothetical protein